MIPANTLILLSIASLIIPSIFAMLLLKQSLDKATYMFVLLIVFAGYTELMARVLGMNGINNLMVYSIYTWFEWVVFTYVLLDFSHTNKRFIIIPAAIGLWLLPNEVLLTKAQMSTTLMLILYTLLCMAITKTTFYGSQYILVAGIAFYCFNALIYSHSLYATEFFSYMNITTNFIYGLSMGVEWKRKRHFTLFSERVYSLQCAG